MLKLATMWLSMRCPFITASIVIAAISGVDGLNDPASRPIPEARRYI